MAVISLQGNPIHTSGDLPAKNTLAPKFTLTKTDLTEISLKELLGQRIVLNIFPSVDTPVCANTVRKFNEEASGLTNVVILCVSMDLPFALKRYCAAEGLEQVIPVSAFRHHQFGEDYGVKITDGKLAGLLSRAVVIIDENGQVIYTEQVNEIADEPDYAAALNVLGK
jgi:thioredoxin-dependent peroxiredoxin